MNRIGVPRWIASCRRRLAGPRDALEAHILFISETERSRLTPILAILQGRPALTVGDVNARDFARRGGMIAFITERDKVRLRINPDAARSASLAEIVSREE